MYTLPAPDRQRTPMPPRRRRRNALRRLVAGVGLVVLVAVLLVGVSLWGALRTPGNQSLEAKWADWLRSHHAAAVANAVE